MNEYENRDRTGVAILQSPITSKQCLPPRVPEEQTPTLDRIKVGIPRDSGTPMALRDRLLAPPRIGQQGQDALEVVTLAEVVRHGACGRTRPCRAVRARARRSRSARPKGRAIPRSPDPRAQPWPSWWGDYSRFQNEAVYGVCLLFSRSCLPYAQRRTLAPGHRHFCF